MATIVRIKRSLNEEPINAVVLNCKRRKLDPSSSANDETAVFRFIGTAKTQDEDVYKHIKKSTKTEFEEQFKKHITNISEKLREETASASRESRFKVINCCRSINDNPDPNSSKSSNEQSYTIYDIEVQDQIEGSSNNVNNSDSQYLYDLYYAHWDNFQKGVEDNELISVYPLSDQLIYGSYRDNGIDEKDDESEDSNAEDNWRNDYPDESDMESITEEDMLNAVKKVSLDGEYSLSSDDHSTYDSDKDIELKDEEAEEEDVSRYGKLYAKFKAKHQNEDHNSDLYWGDIDEDEYYY